jgi:hypothetical protein
MKIRWWDRELDFTKPKEAEMYLLEHKPEIEIGLVITTPFWDAMPDS